MKVHPFFRLVKAKMLIAFELDAHYHRSRNSGHHRHYCGVDCQGHTKIMRLPVSPLLGSPLPPRRLVLYLCTILLIPFSFERPVLHYLCSNSPTREVVQPGKTFGLCLFPSILPDVCCVSVLNGAALLCTWRKRSCKPSNLASKACGGAVSDLDFVRDTGITVFLPKRYNLATIFR